ncbi:glycoside hydrolase family 19 protein [Thioflavicoccus mobilis]|uniref:glycoside hydrolase family 19 protein n=1 Tax=Thioflavicoccus mobilis TaxID=80679 RepID=UPI000306957C|nr:glycoside hydrolase family 19 protein [Thioflavicoccus mobilis]
MAKRSTTVSRFKGRGLIQLTGRANYVDFGGAVGRRAEILADPTLVAHEPALCVGAAGWFWDKRRLNAHADRDDLLKVTKVINGGTNGLADRRRLLGRAKGLFGIA